MAAAAVVVVVVEKKKTIYVILHPSTLKSDYLDYELENLSTNMVAIHIGAYCLPMGSHQLQAAVLATDWTPNHFNWPN